MQTTDKDMAHFLSEHYDLLKWVFKLCNLMSRKTVRHYRDENSAYIDLISKLNDAGACGDPTKTKGLLKRALMILEIQEGPVNVKDSLEDEGFKHGFNTGCPFMNHRRD